MYLRFKILGHRFVIYHRKVTIVEGVNSILPDGNHVPMLDLDNCTLDQCITEVKNLQKCYGLGRSTIISTGRKDSFHVYIWSRVPWWKAVAIVSNCKYGDLKHLAYSLHRGHFTLRISKKNGRDLGALYEIPSENPSNVSHKDLDNFVIYETASRLEVDAI